MSVTRYSPTERDDDGPEMKEDPDGWFVSFDDYKRLENVYQKRVEIVDQINTLIAALQQEDFEDE